MKKLAFLLALITSITACGFGELLIPMPPTPTLSTEASVVVTNTDLHVSFRHPEGWALMSSGILKHIPNPVQYATYGIKWHPDLPTFTITKDDFGVAISQDHLVDTVARSSQQHGADIVEELRVTVHGLPAGGVRYIRKREVGFRLIASQLHQTNDFEWTSDVEYLNELEQIYRAMLPTIRIEPPPRPPQP